MIEIDGSTGEGGGQVLRTSLALSVLTGTPVKITKIRAGRKKPGLARQHITCIKAAAEISGASVSDFGIGSKELEFSPGAAKAGNYCFDIESAGSTGLVLQTILLPLVYAHGKSSITIKGGTHNPMSPPFDFLRDTFLPVLKRMGADVKIRLVRHGFFPDGGGEICVEASPCEKLAPMDLLVREKIMDVSARALIARLPVHIGGKQMDVVSRRLFLDKDSAKAVIVKDSAGPGNAVILSVRDKNIHETFTAFSERGVAGEVIANRAVEEVRRYFKAKVAVGPYLADQLLLPMALAGGGTFKTVLPSNHTRTNAEIIGRFLPVDIAVKKTGDDSCVIAVKAKG